MKVGYIGNFEPEHSTENHVRKALEANGHEVVPYQENKLTSWERATNEVGQLGLLLWTRTGWERPIPHDVQHLMLRTARARGVATVGYHLDRWWGLKRQTQVRSEPFFSCELVCTADGGHQDRFAEAGVNHAWFPPGVLGSECARAPVRRAEFAHDVVFVGSWDSYHSEWAYRIQLVKFLKRQFPTIGMYPLPGQHALRGQDLVDLYANCKVVVGDSCLASHQTHYWSDRIPETLGRGGFLIHPEVEGMEGHFEPGEHLVTYTLGDYGQLLDLINQYVKDDDARSRIASSGRKHALAHHTYEVRMRELMQLLAARRMV